MIEKNAMDFAKDEFPDSLNLVMRLIDDYLLITTEKKVASKFLEKMFECAEKNDFCFNENKITTNFSYVFNGESHLNNSQTFENSKLITNFNFYLYFRLLYLDWKNY